MNSRELKWQCKSNSKARIWRYQARHERGWASHTQQCWAPSQADNALTSCATTPAAPSDPDLRREVGEVAEIYELAPGLQRSICVAELTYGEHHERAGHTVKPERQAALLCTQRKRRHANQNPGVLL